MKVEILFIGKKLRSSSESPSRYSIYRTTLRHSEFSVYATNAYGWVCDDLWSNFQSLKLGESMRPDMTYAYRAEVDVGYSASDVDVLLSLTREISRTTALSCRMSIIPDKSEKSEKNVDVLLLQLADAIDTESDLRSELLEQYQCTDGDYLEVLTGRLWLVEGNVRILSGPSTATVVAYHSSNGAQLDGSYDTIFGIPEFLNSSEQSLSEHLQGWIENVSHQMRFSCVSFAAYVSPLLSLALKRFPSCALRQCLLHHLVYLPLRSASIGQFSASERINAFSLVPAFEPGAQWEAESVLSLEQEKEIVLKEQKMFDSVRDEIEITRINQRGVRTPLQHVPRFLYELLLDDNLPYLSEKGIDVSDTRVEAEWRMGARISFAMERWRYRLSANSVLRHCGEHIPCSSYWGCLLKVYDEAKKQVEKILGSEYSIEKMEHFRRLAMRPYPLDFHFVIPVLGTEEFNGVQKNISLNPFRRFEDAMFQLDETNSSYSAQLGDGTSSSSDNEAQDPALSEVLGELEEVFFDDLNLTVSKVGDNETTSLNETAVANVVDNKLFRNALKIIGEENDVADS